MNKFEYINKNLPRIRMDVRMGFIPTGIIRHYEIYSRYDYYLKQGHKTCLSIHFAGEDLRVSDRTVFRIIKDMEILI